MRIYTSHVCARSLIIFNAAAKSLAEGGLVDIDPKLRQTINGIIGQAQQLCPGYTIYSLISTPPSASTSSDQTKPTLHSQDKDEPLHISLTHPLPLRRSQILPFRDELRSALLSARASSGTTRGGPGSGSESGPVRLSLPGEVVGFVNGRRSGGEGRGGRAFLALRVSAGSPDVSKDSAIAVTTGGEHD